MRDGSNPQDGTIGSYHSANNSRDPAIHVARSEGSLFDESRDSLREIPVALLVNQSGLNYRVTRLSNSIVTTQYRVSFENVTSTQYVEASADPHEPSKRAAAAVAVREIVRPAPRGSQRNRRRLSCRIPHGTNFVHQLHLHGSTAN